MTRRSFPNASYYFHPYSPPYSRDNESDSDDFPTPTPDDFPTPTPYSDDSFTPNDDDFPTPCTYPDDYPTPTSFPIMSDYHDWQRREEKRERDIEEEDY